MSIISFIYRLLFSKNKKYTDKNQSELFHSDDYLRPDSVNYRKCPNCSTEAKTNREVVEIFGIRTIDGKPKLQSWCRVCRNEKEHTENNSPSYQEKINIK